MRFTFNKQKQASLTVIILGLTMLISSRSQAHIVNEIPWHPVPEAYLRALFFANLGPNINWEMIAAEFETPIAPFTLSVPNTLH